MKPSARIACVHHNGEMNRAGRLGVDAAPFETPSAHEIADGRQAGQRRLGVDDPQAFDEVAGDADGDQQHEDADVGRAAGEAADAAPAPIRETSRSRR